MTFLGETEQFSGKNGAFKVEDFSGEIMLNVKKPIYHLRGSRQ